MKFQIANTSIGKAALANDANLENNDLSKIVEIRREDFPEEPASWTLYENGEDGNLGGWHQYYGGTLSNIQPGANSSDRAILIIGNIETDVFRLANEDSSPWINRNEFFAEFSIAFDPERPGALYFQVETTMGTKYLAYGSYEVAENNDPNVIYYRLANSVDGRWHTVFRSLDQDIRNRNPGITLNSVNSLFVYGSMKLDDLKLLDFQ